MKKLAAFLLANSSDRQQLERLKAQLATKDALLASKEETLTLLRASYNQPNEPSPAQTAL